MNEEILDQPVQGKWSDREIFEIVQDRFGTQDYANVLANRAATADTPLSIGIYGRWGSGKTSLMRLVEKSLSNREKPIDSIWINVWQLSNREELWNAFLQALFTQVHKRLAWKRRWGFNWSLFRERVNWIALVRTLLVNSYRIVIAVTPVLLAVLWPDDAVKDASGLLAFTLDPLTGGLASLILGLWLVIAPAIQAAKEKVSIDFDVILKKNPYEVQVSELQQLQTQFERLVKTLVGDVGRLVIFIDDLDRCTPDKMPEVLEAIKLFTNTPRCVYLIGVDHEIVCKGIMTRYKFDEAEAAEYLEKIIQIPFHLPGLEEYLIGRFVRDDYSDVHHICPTAPEVFAKGLEPNPRTVKRVLNIYRTLWELSNIRVDNWEMDPVDAELLAKMVVLQNRFSDLYEHFRSNEEDIPLVEKGAILRIKSYRDDVEEHYFEREIRDIDLMQIRIYLPVQERDREALDALFASGNQRFYEIHPNRLSSYIYLTGTAEGESELMRPSRQERDALLSNETPRVREQVEMILSRAANSNEREQLADSYLKRLQKVIDTPNLYSDSEIASASYAQAWFEVEGFSSQVLEKKFAARREGLLLEAPEKVNGSAWRMGYMTALWEALRDKEHPNNIKSAIIDLLYALEAPFLPQLVQIPSGSFLMGSTEEQARMKNEQPRHSVELADYRIGKYPVTNVEYLAFVEDSQHAPPRHWDKDAPPQEKSDHPVVNVSWHDAMAYCRWLSEKSGKSYRLPSEAEWEKAARGEDGYIYPWGDEIDPKRCNTRESGIGDTSPVGHYSPHGDSPYGCVDMAGNVWEWTRNLDKAYPYDAEDGREDLEASGHRVLRGGSWDGDRDFAGCARRYWLVPDYGLNNIGFRVVVSPA